MTKQELKDLIDEKITDNGEGAITGGVLNEILNDIVDSEDGEALLCQYDQLPITNGTLAQACALFGITVEDFNGIFEGRYQTVYVDNALGIPRVALKLSSYMPGWTVWGSTVNLMVGSQDNTHWTIQMEGL